MPCPPRPWSPTRRGRCQPARSEAPVLSSALGAAWPWPRRPWSRVPWLRTTARSNPLAGDLESDQRGRTGGRPLVGAAVGEPGEDPLGLPPGAQPGPAGSLDLPAGSQVVDQPGGGLRGLVVHELPVDHHHGCVVARGVALDVLEGDLPVLGGLVVSDVEVVLQRCEDLVATHDRAQRVGADPHVVVADRTTLVHRVEGRDAADLGSADAEDLGARLDSPGSDLSLGGLDEMEHRQQARARVRVPCGDLFQLAQGLS